MTSISKPNISPGAMIAWGIIGIIVIVIVAGLITLFAWNTGLVAALAAFGVAVGKVTFVEAVAINFALGCLGRVFRPTPKFDFNGKS